MLSQHISTGLENAYLSTGCVDMAALSVIPGEQCWVVYVDTLVGRCVCDRGAVLGGVCGHTGR